MALITALSNNTIKRIRALRQRKERDETGACFVEGLRIVGEAVQLGAQIEALVVSPDLLTSPFGRDLVAAQRGKGIIVHEVTPEVFESVSSKDGPQGIGAVIRQRWEPLAMVRLAVGGSTQTSTPPLSDCWIALDSTQDPGNIGTILRTADAVGAAGLILTGSAADPYDPSAVRASMGAVFALRLVRASFADFAAWKGRHGYRVIGTSDHAAHDYQAIRYDSPLILLMGSEREGLSAAQMAACDEMARIPMAGRSDSLNLAVATGVMLYEMFNQRRGASGAKNS